MHYLLSAQPSERFLLEELGRVFPHRTHRGLGPGLVGSDFPLEPGSAPVLAFARQCLPEATERQAGSIRAWAELLWTAVCGLPPDQPWRLHIAPHYGTGPAGQSRCRLIRQELIDLLRRKRRALLRTLQEAPEPFSPTDSLVQLLLLAPDRGLLSVARAPGPYQWRRLLSPFPKGHVTVPPNKAPPSRAFAKLLEAELRLGCRIGPGEVCVDLGAAPGSWTYVAVRRGARVIAVDRAPLRADLMRHPHVQFHRGDAFGFRPDRPVDWLLCDVIAAPSRTIALLLDWVHHQRARRFVVTIKFKGHADYGLLEPLKEALARQCLDFRLSRLCANKNEVCAFGLVQSDPAPSVSP